ncbi:hypothetical protein [Pollutibacter soli]|uniref:hypothetical protein n=1 Tax=Pollutibacter soli TaxID=3034157 RepID=UPI00301335AD
MKRILFTAAIFLVIGASAQSGSISFENSWKKGSDIVYVGVTNELTLTGRLEEIRNIRCSSGSVLRNGDKLIIKPSVGNMGGGAMKIEIETTEGIDSLVLNTERLPIPEISISGGTGMLTEIPRDKFLESPTLKVSAKNSKNENIFEGYKLLTYEVVVNNTIYKETDSVFSNELKEIIAALPEGKTFSVNNISMLNPETGKTFTLSLHKVFQLN